MKWVVIAGGVIAVSGKIVMRKLRISDITELAHFFAGSVLAPGDIAVDCTAGNGNDMLFLLKATGPDGFVYGFDIQAEAISATRALLDRAGITPERYSLARRSHAELAEEVRGPVSAFMFNLGYLPGGDRSVTTEPEEVKAGLGAAMEMLRANGLITVVIYTGHEGGRAELDALLDFGASVDDRRFRVMHVSNMNGGRPSPSIMVIQKKG